MAVALNQLYTPQASALAYGKKFRSPLAAKVHAELPAKIESGRYQADLDLAEKELAQDREQFEKTYGFEEASFAKKYDFDKSAYEQSHALQQSALALEKSKYESAMEAARKAEGIQTAGLGISAGMSLAEMYKGYLADQSKIKAAADAGKTIESSTLPGQEYAGTLVAPVTGFGVGYGVKKYTGSTTKGVAAGTGAALVADYLTRGSDSLISDIWSVAKDIWDVATGWWG